MIAGDNTLFGATERAGRYTVTITATGFQPLVLPAIRVGKTADGCHVITEERRAALLR